MPADHASRRRALRALLAERDLDALLVTDLLNIRYLTGSPVPTRRCSSPRTTIRRGRTVICTDGRYATQVAAQVPDLRAEIARASARISSPPRPSGPASWGFESHVVTVDQHSAWDGLGSADLVRPAPGLVEELRMVKDDYEVGLLRAACAAADARWPS